MPNPCGKNCDECGVREEIHCGGCASVVSDAGCEIAACVSKNNHESCATCTMRASCSTRRQAPSMHEHRRRAAEEAQRKRERIRENAAVCSKWMRILFWLTIAQIPLSLIDDIINRLAVQRAVGMVSAVFVLVTAFCLLKLQDAEGRYRTAALLQGGAGLLNVLSVIVFDFFLPDVSVLRLIFALPAAVMLFAATYQTYTAHSWVTADLDRELSDNWERLWKWEIIALAGTLGSPLLAFLGLLGALAILAVLVFSIIVDVLSIVWLRRSAELFREWTEE